MDETSDGLNSESDSFSTTIPVDSVVGGQLEAADHLLIGCSTYALPHLPVIEVANGFQPQQAFSLPGWNLTLALAQSELVVKAVPTSGDQMTEEKVDRLNLRLFNLLSFLFSREAGIGPIAGLDSSGAIVWAGFSSSRRRPGRPGFKWCADQTWEQLLRP